MPVAGAKECSAGAGGVSRAGGRARKDEQTSGTAPSKEAAQATQKAPGSGQDDAAGDRP